MKALRLALVAALLSAAGAPWVLVQAAAWARMAASGVSLDGRHPCALCLTARNGAASQQRTQARATAPRANLCGASPIALACPRPARPTAGAFDARPRPAFRRLDPPPPWLAA